MNRMRKRIAERLKDSQNTAAMLTTFQEVDMHNLIQMRNRCGVCGYATTRAWSARLTCVVWAQAQGRVLCEARREAGLHVPVHQGVRGGPAGDPGRERGHRWR